MITQAPAWDSAAGPAMCTRQFKGRPEGNALSDSQNNRTEREQQSTSHRGYFIPDLVTTLRAPAFSHTGPVREGRHLFYHYGHRDFNHSGKHRTG